MAIEIDPVCGMSVDTTTSQLSLDHDGTGWVAVGRRDPVIGRLQEQYHHLRPVCFYSAYEAATSLVIGQRISMAQGARVKRWLAEEAGDAIEIGRASCRERV